MSSLFTTKELSGMQTSDLQKEIRSQRSHVQKMRVQITMNTEKDTAKYRREKKALARMMTFLTAKKGAEGEKGKEDALKTPAKNATISAPKRRKRST